MAFNVNNCYGGGNSEWGKTRRVIVTFLLRKKRENFIEKSIEFSGEILPFLSCENTLYSHHRCLSMKKSKNENFKNECFRATVHEFVQKRVLTSIEKPTDSKQANSMPINVQIPDPLAKNEHKEKILQKESGNYGHSWTSRAFLLTNTNSRKTEYRKISACEC